MRPMGKHGRLLAAGALVAFALIAWAFVHLLGGGYERREAERDSSDVQSALEVLRSIAADPESVPSHMCEGAKEMARHAVSAMAKSMHSRREIELVDVAWFGDFMRMHVICDGREKGAVDSYFYLKKERDRMCIAGVEK